jgi:hypothetical protein
MPKYEVTVTETRRVRMEVPAPDAAQWGESPPSQHAS